ncbi:hypothetical protein BASA81_006197 [Batrachochytrium salamandrivorans]|nr:hypothetical protein BASA81_006197 [Batrachochytrium salamandrivorans]
MSGFQTFQSGRVIDFLDYNHGEKELMSSLEEFEQVLANLLREKLVDEAAADVLREGRPTSADSCVVINFELVRRDGTTASVLRVVETCGVEHCQDENEVWWGTLFVGMHPLCAACYTPHSTSTRAR